MIPIFIFICIGTTAVFAWMVRLEYRKDRIPILIYHRIVPDDKMHLCRRDSYVIAVKDFRSQMQFLKDNGYTPIDLNDYLYFREHRQELPEKPVILTFDDGYENNYLYAFPILREFGFKAVIYSITDSNSSIFNSFEFPERLLSPEQMKEMSDYGISIQGHTKTHPFLKYLDDDSIRAEIKESKETLEAITQKPVIHMAIPYGSCDARLLRIVQEAGFKTLEVPGKGTVNLDTNPFNLRRLSIHQNIDLRHFKRLLDSPAYIILNRVYAASHLLVRRILGKNVERALKRSFAQAGLDNAESLAKVVLAAAVAGILIFILFLKWL